MFRALRRFWERGTKGYCYEDMWNFDSWLSATIARGLREFKAATNTYPNDINNWEEWQAVLSEMIECFEEQNRDTSNLPRDNFVEQYQARMANKKQKLHRGLELLEKYYFDLWD